MSHGDNLCSTQVHESSIVIDCLTWLYKNPPDYLDPNSVTAVNVTVGKTTGGFAESVEDIAELRREVDSDPRTTVIESADDILEAKRNNKVGLILGLQHNLAIGRELSRIELFYRLGLRIMGLAYNERSFAGDGCLEPNDGGLSCFGRRAIQEMNSVGMVIDLSHSGHRTNLEAIEASRVPPIFSHSNPISVTDHPRNATDEEIRALADAGGVIGCCSWAPICWRNRPGVRPSIDDFVDHIDYVVALVGIDHVGLSTDSPCAEDPWIHQHLIEFAGAFPEITGPYMNTMFEDLSKADPLVVRQSKHPIGTWGVQDIVVITDALLRRGYKPEDVRKILGENFLRLFAKIWQ